MTPLFNVQDFLIKRNVKLDSEVIFRAVLMGLGIASKNIISYEMVVISYEKIFHYS